MITKLNRAPNFRSTLRVYSIQLLGLLIGLAGFLGINITYFQNLVGEARLAVLFISFLTFYYFVAHISTRAKWEKYYKYTNLFSDLNDGFKEIHNLHRKQDVEVSKQEVIYAFEKLCSDLALGFTIVTQTKCSVCIKILIDTDLYEHDDLEFKTLCRDNRAAKKRLEFDKLSRKKNSIVHTLKGNTAFTQALGNEEIFNSNKLPFLGNYKNTSANKDLYGEIPEDTITRIRNWPLPYVSTIVVPIIPAHSEYLEDNEDNEEVIGFICLDSKKYGAFDKEIDGEILKGVADGIFNTLMKFNKLVNK